MEDMTFLQKMLDQELARWQGVLRLQDWDMEASFVHQYEMPTQESLGMSVINGGLRQVRIKILHPDDTRPDNHELSSIPDWRETLIHELVHIYTCQIMDYKGLAREHAVEVLCDRVAQALLGLETAR